VHLLRAELFHAIVGFQPRGRTGKRLWKPPRSVRRARSRAAGLPRRPERRRKDCPNVITLSARCTGFEPGDHYIVSRLSCVHSGGLDDPEEGFRRNSHWRDGACLERSFDRGRISRQRFPGPRSLQSVLSPKPLGPPASFTPGPLDVTVDRENNRVHVDAEPAATPKVVVRSARAAHPRADQMRHVTQPRLLARTKFAHHHGNPLDAQAFDAKALDARIQVWPCKSGGICNWRR
jgi:hypothetical protein